MFEPYLKSFFVHSHDPTSIKLLKVTLYTLFVLVLHVCTLYDVLEYCKSRDLHVHVFTTFQLEIIANVAGETSIHAILKEFRVSVHVQC